jgi:hypothetical protein
MTLRISTPSALLLALGLVACGGDPHGHSHGPDGSHAETEHEHAEVGPHGGHLVEVGDHVAHIELTHEAATNTLTLHVLGADAKSPLSLAKAPEIKLMTEDGPRVLATSGEGHTFTVSDAALKDAEPEGRVTLEIDGKVYNPDLAHEH